MNTACRTARRAVRYRLGVIAIAGLSLSPWSLAQTASPAPAEQKKDDAASEEIIELSPFVVSAAEDRGSYRATSTLAGTRVRTDLKDVASAVSVVTAEFLRDTGATNNQTLLQYTANTEVGGIYGNFAGVGSTFINGITETSNFVRPSANTRVRGLDSADNTRDFFQSDIPWDSYNVGRVDLQRGPNSILFGLGSPAGIINASINTAGFQNSFQIENRIGSFGTVRNSVDANHVLLKNELSVRFALLDDDTKYQQDPAFRKDQRAFGALTWQKDIPIFGDKTARTTFRANYEYGDVKSNQPRILPPDDRITPFFDAGGINKQTWDPTYAWTYGVFAQEPIKITNIGEATNYWVSQEAGFPEGNNPVFIYDNTTGKGGNPILVRQGQGSHRWGINSAGVRDGNYDGAAYHTSLGIHSFSGYAANINRYHPDLYPGAQAGLYKDRALTDRSIFDYFNHLIDGPNKSEWQHWNAYNLSLEQTFLNNRIGFQLVYDRQDYRDGAERNMDNPFITVDINKNTLDYPGIIYTTANGYAAPYLATANPNAGRAFVAGRGNGQANFTDRENFRATVTGELRADDFLAKSATLTRLLGRHIFTGLYSSETYTNEARSWSRQGMDYDWSNTIGEGPNDSGTDAQSGWGSRKPAWKMYLSAPLFTTASASGLNLQPITTQQSPYGSTSIWWENSHWKWPLDPNATGYVDPAAPWSWPGLGGAVNQPKTQSENAANYGGWSFGSFNVKNADVGDRDELYTNLSRIQKRTTSEGITWQAYLWDDILVGTVGWRRDRQEQRSGAAEFSSALGYVPLGYDYNPERAVSTGDSVSWGLVAHVSKLLRRELPYGSQVSLFFNKGVNSRVESRYGFDGVVIPNAKGRTTDYGVVLSTLDGRLQLKVTAYKTQVADANIASVTTQASTLGSATYNVHYYEAVGTAVALTNVAGFAGDPEAPNWFWNYALVDDNGWGNPAYDDPNGPATANHPSVIKEKAAIDSWLAQMPSQQWFDAFGYHVNVAAAKAKDYRHAIEGFNPTGYVGVFPAGAGMINGVWPTGTVDNESKGLEFELTGQIKRNWNVAFNASKQTASQTALGASLSQFIEQQHAKFEGPAGDLRLWWGGDLGIREYYKPVWAAYQFQKETNGKMVPEMSPWRFNAVTNYSFDHGLLKGFNVGGGVRWQRGVILGYALNAAKDNLDVDKPYWGPSNYAVDCWFGYSRKLTRKIDWRIQLNIRNLDSQTHLERINAQPDGSSAGFRIVEGQTWMLTNSLSF